MTTHHNDRIYHYTDIPSELASVRLSATGDRISEFAVYPEVPPMLEESRRKGCRLGIRADPGPASREVILQELRRCGILGYFEPDEIVLEHDDGSAKTFHVEARAAATKDGAEPGGEMARLFISPDAALRARIRGAGLPTAPHLVLADSVLGPGGALWYLRIRVTPAQAGTDWRGLLRGLPLVPLHVESALAEEPHPVVYAVGSTATAAELDGLGFWVDRMGGEDEPQTSDLLLVTHHEREDGTYGVVGSVPGASAHLVAEPTARVLASMAEGLLVSVSAQEPGKGEDDPHMHHFHGTRLLPSTTLLDPEPALPRPFTGRPGAGPLLNVREAATIKAEIEITKMRAAVARFSGAVPLRDDLVVESRDVHHPHNPETVLALAGDLAGMTAGEGGQRRFIVGLHPFRYNCPHYRKPIPCANVEARLPRSGLSGAVIISAHLDSFAQGGDPATSRARGADDDASGIAGVLCAARALLQLAATARIHREIRFLLFNAEEHGLIGSGRYALERKKMRDDIVGVFQMDMVGYDAIPPRYYEIHASGKNEAVLAASGELARLVEAVAPEVCEDPRSPLEPQLFSGPDTPLNGYSDHSSFHEHGFAACLVCEDLSKNDCGPTDKNPHWHTPDDTEVHFAYATDVARAVAAAAWVAATRVGPPWV